LQRVFVLELEKMESAVAGSHPGNLTGRVHII